MINSVICYDRNIDLKTYEITNGGFKGLKLGNLWRDFIPDYGICKKEFLDMQSRETAIT